MFGIIASEMSVCVLLIEKNLVFSRTAVLFSEHSQRFTDCHQSHCSESPPSDQRVPKWSQAVTLDWIWTPGDKLDFLPPVEVKVVRPQVLQSGVLCRSDEE